MRVAQCRGFDLQRLEIIGDGFLRLAGLDQHVAEIAPAGRQSRHQPQRRLVVGGGRFEVAADHAGVAELGMQFGSGLDRRAAGGCGLDRGQAKLEGGEGVVVAAGGVVFLADAAANARPDVACGFGARGRGGHRGLRSWNYACVSEGNRTMKIVGKQSLAGSPGRGLCRDANALPECFGRRLWKHRVIPAGS